MNLNPISLYLRGVLMGIADIVPGVSGGTVALITGIYPRFVQALSTFSLLLRSYIWKRIFRGEFSSTLRKFDFHFLATLGLGMASGVFALAKAMQYLSENAPIPMWSFFFSLIFFSALSMLKEFEKKTSTFGFMSLGIVVVYFVVSLSPASQSDTQASLPYIFLCGFVAISAMLLPGISGSFMLLLMGQYNNLLIALNSFNLHIVSVFALGCITGILVTSRLLSWLLKHFYMPMFAFLCGVMFGSLLKLWPWKATTTPLISPTSILTSWAFKINDTEIGLLPQDYTEMTGQPAHLPWAILAFVLAMLLSIYLTHLRTQKK